MIHYVICQKCIDKSCTNVSALFRLIHIIFPHDVGTLAFLSFSTMLGWCECKAVQGIVGNVGCPWESLVPTGNGEAGNASLPNKTAEQKIWRRRADWTIGQCREEEKKRHTLSLTHTLPHAIVLAV